MTHGTGGHVGVGIGLVAQRVEMLVAEEAAATGDGEGHHDAIALFQVVHRRTGFDDLPHELVTDDIAFLHTTHQAIVKVQVGTTDRGRGDLDDRVTRLQDPGIVDVIDANVVRAVPSQCFHGESLLVAYCLISFLRTL